MGLSLIRIHLALLDEHIAQGERHIARQRGLLALLASGGHNTEDAWALLHEFEDSQAVHLADRDRLRQEFAECQPALGGG